MSRLPLEVRFWAKVQKTDACWLWTAAKHPFGYGHIKIDGRVEAAHRVSWQMARGPVPEGLVLDHLCRTPSCVRPDHMEPVTLWENTRRGTCYSAEAVRKTHCKHGHEFTPENTYHWRTSRICRTCKGIRDASARRR